MHKDLIYHHMYLKTIECAVLIDNSGYFNTISNYPIFAIF